MATGASDALTEDKTADEARRPDANAGTQDGIQLDGTVPDGRGAARRGHRP